MRRLFKRSGLIPEKSTEDPFDLKTTLNSLRDYVIILSSRVEVLERELSRAQRDLAQLQSQLKR